jgi:hypothetical protein
MRRRSFRKLNKKYPLTKFFGFMAGPQGLSINVSWHYVTEIRKMLGWMVSRQIEAKTEEEKKQWGVTGWMAFENVLDYFQTLSTTEARWFQAAWNQWLGFAGDLATPLR